MPSDSRFHEKSHPRTAPRVHKLNKLDFSMSCHSDKLKLDIAKDLKPLASKMKVLVFQNCNLDKSFIQSY